VGEQIALARGGALRLLPRGALVGELVPRGVARGDFSGRGLASAERIEQHPLAIALQEQLVLVLAMDVHQHLAQLAKLRGGGGPAIHEAARARTGIHGAAQDAGAIALVQVLRRQPIAHGGELLDVEIRAHLGARRARAHDARIRAPAQGQSERIHEDRFARARLAGERGESRRQLEIEPLDDHIIPDG
jgi:hypothetical protein